MPTKRYGKVKRLLNNGLAKVLCAKPFTIQLLYQTTEFKQPIVLGIDSGYENIGFSAVKEKEELLSGEVKMLRGQSSRIKERSSYRRQRRSSLRYRAPKFDNRKRAVGSLAPSIQNKLDTHIHLVEKVSRYLPISKVIVEVAAFDIQKIKDPATLAKDYQQGEQAGFYNLREYILHRDNHSCQNPNCTNKAKEKMLQVHHLGYWQKDGSDRPANLITLCNKCHKPESHKQGGFLYGWQPKLKSFNPETFMSTIRWRLVNELNCGHTYGYITKRKRVELKQEKSHANDAFIIAGGQQQKRIAAIAIAQVRHNNRSLEKFYDAVYLDARNGEKAQGQELTSGRRNRNFELKSENLRKYRAKKLKTGRRSIRVKRYALQPKDIVIYQEEKFRVAGIQNYGEYIKLALQSKPVRTINVKIYRYGRGLLIA